MSWLWLGLVTAVAAPRLPTSEVQAPGELRAAAGVGGVWFFGSSALGGLGVHGSVGVAPRLVVSGGVLGGAGASVGVYPVPADNLFGARTRPDAVVLSSLAVRFNVVETSSVALGVAVAGAAGGTEVDGGIAAAGLVVTGDVGGAVRVDFALPVLLTDGQSWVAPIDERYLAALALAELAVRFSVGPGTLRVGKGLEGLVAGYRLGLSERSWLSLTVGASHLWLSTAVELGTRW